MQKGNKGDQEQDKSEGQQQFDTKASGDNKENQDKGESASYEQQEIENLEELETIGEQQLQQGKIPVGRLDGKPDIPPRIIEQWLQQVEGEPSQLIQQQFLNEEKRQLGQGQRLLYESRPW